MKNISRRVFIKGLAVAGVAAAASTVLAGCNTNMIPGVDNGTEEPETTPTPANTYTFKDGDNTLVISSSKVESTAYASQGKVNLYVALDVKNNLGENVGFTKTAAATKAAVYQIVPTLTLYGADGQTLAASADFTASANDNSLYNANTTLITVVDGKTKSGYLYLEDVDEKWTRLDVKFTVSKKVEYNIGTTGNVMSELEDFTFTYNK